jgi:alpha-tubulin suppressor-like RCC1 family protein
MPRTAAARVCLPALALVLAACEQLTGPKPIVSLTLSPAAPTLLVGQTLHLDPNALDESGSDVEDGAIAWTTNASGVATVDGNGVVTAVGVGDATITATATEDGVVSTATITVVALPTWSALSVGWAHACAVQTGGGTYCWGINTFGQIGDGTTAATRTSPTLVQGAPSFVELAAGIHHTCGRNAAGALQCWGRNDFGQLGDSSFAMRTTPVPSGGARTFVRIGAGANRNHTCGITSLDRIQCWGLNLHGQLGDGTDVNSAVPLEVPGGLAFTRVAQGFRHTCALTTTGAAYCWGSNAEGQLGDGTLEPRPAPTAVSGGLTFTSIAATFQHSCALTAAGAAYCWGANPDGQLGNGTNAPSSTPVAVTGGHVFASLIATPGGGCGLTAAGAAYCWGENSEGQLGDGTVTDRNAPVAVSGGHAFTTIGVGSRSGCGRTTAGEIVCWGGNAEGQLGDGTLASRLFWRSIGLPLSTPIYEEVWSGNVGPSAVTLRLRVIGTAVSGTGTANDPADPPAAQLRVTGTIATSGAVSLALQAQPQFYNGELIDANSPTYPLSGTRTSATRIVGTVTLPSGNVTTTLTRQ